MTLLNNIHAVKECQDIPACHASAIVNASRQPAHRLISENNTGMDAHRVKAVLAIQSTSVQLNLLRVGLSLIFGSVRNASVQMAHEPRATAMGCAGIHPRSLYRVNVQSAQLLNSNDGKHILYIVKLVCSIAVFLLAIGVFNKM